MLKLELLLDDFWTLPLAPMHVIKDNKTNDTAYIMTPSIILRVFWHYSFSRRWYLIIRIIVQFNHEEEGWMWAINKKQLIVNWPTYFTQWNKDTMNITPKEWKLPGFRILQHFNFSGNFMAYMSRFQWIFLFISRQFMQSIFPNKTAHKSSPQKRRCVFNF